MATLEEVKEEIGQLRLEHGNKLTRLETLVEPMPEQLKKIEESLRALERSHAEHKGPGSRREVDYWGWTCGAGGLWWRCRCCCQPRFEITHIREKRTEVTDAYEQHKSTAPQNSGHQNKARFIYYAQCEMGWTGTMG